MKNLEYLVGRVVQFSYLVGTKRERHYSADYVDLTKESCRSIGCFANWYQATWQKEFHLKNAFPFKPNDHTFTPGYLPMDNYVVTISNSVPIEAGSFPFAVPIGSLQKLLPQWSRN